MLKFNNETKTRNHGEKAELSVAYDTLYPGHGNILTYLYQASNGEGSSDRGSFKIACSCRTSSVIGLGLGFRWTTTNVDDMECGSELGIFINPFRKICGYLLREVFIYI